ncbi:hypothetical protein VTJ04DRAFT_8335 [Mycothermus thermophilus]
MADPMLKAKGIAQMDFALGSHDDQGSGELALEPGDRNQGE